MPLGHLNQETSVCRMNLSCVDLHNLNVEPDYLVTGRIMGFIRMTC